MTNWEALDRDIGELERQLPAAAEFEFFRDRHDWRPSSTRIFVEPHKIAPRDESRSETMRRGHVLGLRASDRQRRARGQQPGRKESSAVHCRQEAE